MLQIRVHGRGGQGVVTAAEMLSIAAFQQGRHAQAFPSFGSERKGAPVGARGGLANEKCRMSDLEPVTLTLPGTPRERSARHLESVARAGSSRA
jgi:Pyruvate/2-oxoacid:ferredoxin oxidoreductase gamma subunit